MSSSSTDEELRWKLKEGGKGSWGEVTEKRAGKPPRFIRGMNRRALLGKARRGHRMERAGT
jgi:hypothetical protein